jgi:two-component system phosphate regulon response regulator PhoB
MEQKKTVLIVDDEIDMRLFLKTLLETSGYHTLRAQNGAEGLEAAIAHQPDLIILDIMMPKEGGVQMYGQLKTRETLRQIPVIVLSAISRKTFFHYLKMLSVRLADVIPEPDAYLEKPPEAQEVLTLVADLTRGRPESKAAQP